LGYHRRAFIAVEQGVNALASVVFFSFLLIQRYETEGSEDEPLEEIPP
jgi:hypothetical protein